MVHVRSAVAGAAATVVVGVGVFFAVSAGNAAEPVEVEAPAVVGHYSTVESQDPIVYVPEPVVVPAPVAVEPEAIVVKPAPQPAPVAPLVQGTAPPAGSGVVVVQPGTVMPPPPPGVVYVPPPPPDPPPLP